MKSRFIYNLLGTFFDKGLILFTSFYLTSLISVSDYGKWVLFYQFVIIAMSLSFAPLYSIFSRRYSQIGDDSLKKLPIYQKELFSILIIIIVSVYLIFVEDFVLSSLFLLSLLSFGSYNYLSLYFRFSENDRTYFLVSLLRILIYIITIFVGLSYSFRSEKLIVVAFLLCNTLVVIPYLKYFKIIKSSHIKSNEFLNLLFYGASSALMNGMDKICFGSKFDPEILGIYSYAIALATSSNLVVEAVKKVIVPQMYKDYSRFNELSSNTQKLRNKLMATIFVIQTIAPFVLFYLLRYMDLIKIEYYQYDNFILVLFLNSISFAFFSFYHFLNPLYISLKKSNWMTLSMAIAILVYLSLFILLNTNDILNLSIYRFIMFLIPPLTLIILKSKLKTGN